MEKEGCCEGSPLVAEHFLLQLPALLRFKRKRGSGTGQQTANADGFSRFITVAVVSGVYPADGLFNLLEQLALTVAGAQLERVLFFNRGSFGRPGKRFEDRGR